MKDTGSRNISIFFWIGLVGVLQYLLVTSILMRYYPGGHYFDHSTVGYSFTENFLSDLGRTRNFGPAANPTAKWYALTLFLAGLTTISFIVGIFLYFVRSQPFLAGFALLMGCIAGLGYVGIAMNPVNVHYRSHVGYVQWGFLTFLMMSIAIAFLFRREITLYNMHSNLVWLFVIVLLVQVLIMLFGPRSWSSYDAMRLQVILQKVVVYAEMTVMTYICIVMLRKLRA